MVRKRQLHRQRHPGARWREAVRRRPGMYIGSTDTRGLHHSSTRSLQRVDEPWPATAPHQGDIGKDASITVDDNGRGILSDPSPDRRFGAPDRLHHAARRRQVRRQSYKVSAVCTAWAPPWSMPVREAARQVRRDGKIHQIEFERGVPKGKISVVGEAPDTAPP